MADQLSVSEAAALRGVTRGRIHQFIREGRLPVTKVGTQFIIQRRDLAKLKIGKPGRPKKS